MKHGWRPHRAVCLVLGLALAGTTGCSDPTADYCEAVKEHQQELSEIVAGGGPAALLEALPIFEDLAEQAPEDIRDEWDTIIDALQALENALEEAGVDPAAYDRENPPPGLSAAERDRIEAAADDVAHPRTSAALAGVDQQARDVCKTPLSI